MKELAQEKADACQPQRLYSATGYYKKYVQRRPDRRYTETHSGRGVSTHNA